MSVPAVLQPSFDMDGVSLEVQGRVGGGTPPGSAFQLLSAAMALVLLGTVSGSALSLVLLFGLGFFLVALTLALLHASELETTDHGLLETTSVHIDDRALTVGEARVPWQEVADVGLGTDEFGRRIFYVSVRWPHTPMSVPASETPEYALEWLVTEIRRRRDELAVSPEEADVIRKQAKKLITRS